MSERSSTSPYWLQSFVQQLYHGALLYCPSCKNTTLRFVDCTSIGLRHICERARSGDVELITVHAGHSSIGCLKSVIADKTEAFGFTSLTPHDFAEDHDTYRRDTLSWTLRNCMIFRDCVKKMVTNPNGFSADPTEGLGPDPLDRNNELKYVIEKFLVRLD